MIDKSLITFPIFDQFNELICAFSTRYGGHSEGIFSSLNMGNIKYDDPQIVKKNRNLFYNKLDLSEKSIALPVQVHSSNVKIISIPGTVPETDALITTEKGLFLSVLTADCLPVFIYAPSNQAVAVIHAGWRGVVQNILEHTLDFLGKHLGAFSHDLYVAIGPGLQKECFEVRSDVFEQFPEDFLDTHEDSSKRFLNLSGFVNQLLISQNVPAEHIYVNNDCTKCNHEHFFSYRRDGVKAGRMMGIIGIRS
jgi:YfiH family protein